MMFKSYKYDHIVLNPKQSNIAPQMYASEISISGFRRSNTLVIPIITSTILFIFGEMENIIQTFFNFT